jgi:hypothetical protein
MRVFELCQNCPDKTCDWEHSWTMQQICDQNDVNRPHPNNARYREILQDFEIEVLDNQDKKHVQHFFSTVFKDVIAPLFDPKLPEMMKIDSINRFYVFAFYLSAFGRCAVLFYDHARRHLAMKNHDSH